MLYGLLTCDARERGLITLSLNAYSVTCSALHLIDLAEQHDEGIVDYCDLSSENQELLEAYDTGEAQRKLRFLEAARSPDYGGTDVEASAC